MDDIDAFKRDQFDLLSTYMDGEASAAERKQVEQWLTTDREFRSMYHRLLSLQRGFQALPTPPSFVSAEQTVEQVMARVNRRSKLILWGLGTATAAAMVSAVTSLFSGGTLIPEIAGPTGSGRNPTAAVINRQPTQLSPVQPSPSVQPSLEPSALMIALDRPPVDIPTPEPQER